MLDGCLVVSTQYSHTDLFEVWMLNGWEGERIWVKLVSFSMPAGFGWTDMRAVAYLQKAHQVVFWIRDHVLIWFDTETQECVKEASNLHRGTSTYQVLPASLMKRNSDHKLPLKVKNITP